ncbi:TonB-dependent receptor [Pseudoduganella sp. DS3]|uniref:TonB-dependent receptor n=1 Tax=Pseudoduganella guangdongensis TaxID=2692179 RepID=A0A6N9HCZ5_9BURK|nr:TonB-dependent receptor [Pseudoduganella guangdongensis]MYN01316.1 TonB-dependent receptor [Pseudoduganella guangdongensis]
MKKLLPLAFASLGVAAASGAAAQSKPADPVLPQVTISGGRQDDMVERRNSTAGKQVYGREELDRNGDNNVGDVLKRLPGVTLGGRPGRGGEVRMRGLGSGYTQVLVNGERPPAGFSMESLSPDQVERIEVMRGPVAEHSARAIAGTINIVLRDGYQVRDVQVKASDRLEHGRHSPEVSVTIPGKQGALNYTVSASFNVSRQQDRSQTRNLDTEDNGDLAKEQFLQSESAGTNKGLHLVPRLSYKFENGDTLNFQTILMHQQGRSNATTMLEQTVPLVAAGEPRGPEYNLAQQGSENDVTFLRGFGNWVHRLQGASKLDVKFGFGLGKRDSDSLRYQYNKTGALLDRFTDTDSIRDKSVNTGGKYTSPLGTGHMLAAGWDLEASQRDQLRVSLDKNGKPQFADSGENLAADTRRIALFAQDEWDITPQWSASIGARWEGIRTTSDRSAGSIANTSKVFSPLLHAVWKIPGAEKDQVRASLTRSYKSPTVQDLIAAPAQSRQNSATSPDRTGNPNLKPELATGLDLAYEHYLGRNGIVSISGFVRKIDDLIRRDLELRQTELGLRWVSAPFNVGKARTSGIELEAKFSLAELMDDAPQIDFRSNYSRFWSKVDGIPGPDNRLDQQARQTANLGMDYRLKDIPLTLGASYNWTPLVRTQVSDKQRVETSRKRVLDMYALWRFDSRTQLRLSANNLLADDATGYNLVYANGLASQAASLNPTYTQWSVRLETKF